MPLTPPVAREALHRREIVLHGYRRADGLFDIEAQLTDTKSYGFANADRGFIDAGEPLHGMWMRITVDPDLLIVACEAATDASPYAICPLAAANFARLEGLRIGPGFLRAANQRVGGVQGCTHLRELLQQLGTVAFQTVGPARVRQEGAMSVGTAEAKIAAKFGGADGLIGSCLAYGTDSPVVKARWPERYTGS